MNFPEKPDKSFFLANQSNIYRKQGFRFCLVTPLLLKVLSKAETICIDATYELNWMGFPLIVMGTVNRNKKFHPMVYACKSNETADQHAFVFRSVKDGIAKHCPGSNFAPHILHHNAHNAVKNDQ